jgi:catechol 2,3-dioxygenase
MSSDAQPNLGSTPSSGATSAGAAAPSARAIDPATQVGIVALTVADLSRSIAFYTRALGCTLLQRSETDAVLGAGGRPLVLIRERRGALPWMTDAMTGLYHFAVLVPRRADLGAWLRHYLTLDFPPPGQGDHVVSEALYLRDPDGHGIEVYADRPREGWRWVDGRVQMGGGPVDLRGILAEASDGDEPWPGLPSGTRLGHMHLQVGDIAQAEAFYHGVLGFDVTARMPTALFVSAGGYHHHIGMNTWHSQGASPAPADTARLRFFTLVLPGEEARRALAARIEAAGVSASREHLADGGDAVVVQDPWQNVIVAQIGTVSDLRAAQALLATGVI